MSTWNPYAQVTRTIPCLFGFVATALSTDWTLIGSTQSPRDLMQHPTYSDVLYMPGSAIVAPEVDYNKSPTTQTTNMRFTCGLKLTGLYPLTGQAAFMGLKLIQGVTSSKIAVLKLNGVTADTKGFHLYTSVSGWVAQYAHSVNDNVWYRVGLEKAGRFLNIYANLTGEADVSDLPDAITMTLLASYTLPPAYESPNGYILPYLGFSGAGAVLDYEGAIAPILEELYVPPTPPLTKVLPFLSAPPGFLGAPGVAIDPSGMTLTKPEMDTQAYHRYKGFRAVTDTINNLSLTP